MSPDLAPELAPRMVRLDLLLFAAHAERLGRTELPVELPAGATVLDLRHWLRDAGHEALLAGQLRVAVNQAMADDGCVLRSGDEVALIPPVAGG